MAWWEWVVRAAALALLLLLAYACALVVRRRVLSRHGGTFEMSCRIGSRDGRGWVLGVGRYAGEELQFFRFFSLAPRPKRVWSRDRLRYERRREPGGTEQVALYVDHVVVCCDSPVGSVELAMTPSSVTGFQAWLEARPPGADWDH